MKDRSRCETLEVCFLHLALWPLGFSALFLLPTALLRFTGVVSPLLTATAALALAGVLVGYSLRPSPWRWPQALLALAAVAGLCVASVALAALCTDLSYDGQAIHFPNAIAMADGVNPVRQRPIFPLGDIYPNGFWTLQGLALTLTSGFEEGKAPAWLLAFTSAPLMALALRVLRGAWTPSVVIAAVLVQLNPVLLMQLTSFELDAPVYSLAVDMVAGAVLLTTRHRRAGLVIAACAFVLLANTKITGLYWACAIAAAMLLQTWWLERRLPLALIAGVTAATLIIGWTPYLSVPLASGQLFGATVAGAIDGPRNLLQADAAARLAYLLFGRSGNPVGAQLAQLQWPWEPLLQPPVHLFDIRVGGFGPGFGLQLLGVLLVGATLVWRMRRGPGVQGRWLGPYWTAVMLLAALAFPVSWWARLAAPFWLVAVLPLVWRADVAAGKATRGLALAGWLMAMTGLVLSGASVLSTLRVVAAVDRDMSRHFAELAAQGHSVRIVPAASAEDQAALLWQQRLIRHSIYPRIGPVDGCGQAPISIAGIQLCVDGAGP